MSTRIELRKWTDVGDHIELLYEDNDIVKVS